VPGHVPLPGHPLRLRLRSAARGRHIGAVRDHQGKH
jgi:hypothetical protein